MLRLNFAVGRSFELSAQSLALLHNAVLPPMPSTTSAPYATIPEAPTSVATRLPSRRCASELMSLSADIGSVQAAEAAASQNVQADASRITLQTSTAVTAAIAGIQTSFSSVPSLSKAQAQSQQAQAQQRQRPQRVNTAPGSMGLAGQGSADDSQDPLAALDSLGIKYYMADPDAHTAHGIDSGVFEDADAEPGAIKSAASKLDWSDLAGSNDIQTEVENNVLLPMKHPDIFDRVVSQTRVKPDGPAFGSFVSSFPIPARFRAFS
jgi:hypothetical protein